ncbi:MAG: UpxY family transcription antiterminator [Cyclobacteriaceae bacterium]|nr:UpxY family transcription antiterminator [Cyclobacteriaceae bacterium]
MPKNWFVFYTKSRQEKKVRDLLTRRGYEVFLPLQKVMRQWSDRKKKVEVPLFNSYIFVCDTIDQVPAILQTPGIAWSIRHNDRPAILHPKDMEVIQRFLSSGLFVESLPAEEFKQGDQVEIIDGPLKGFRGTVNRTSEGDKFSVSLESIGYSLLVTLDSIVLRKI